MLEKKSFNLAQPKRQDGWVSFQAWTRKWNRFFATIFCVLSFLLLFAIVVVNVIETEHEMVPAKDEPLEELREYNIHLEVDLPEINKLHRAGGGCNEIGNRITCQSMSVDDIDQALRTLIKPRLCTKFELFLSNIDFPTGNLSHGWMTVESCSVDVLEIVDSPTLRFIEDGVFDSRAFVELKRLYLSNISVTELRDQTLKGLVRLENLELRDLKELNAVTGNFLEPVKKLLTSLIVENVSLTNPSNLTGVQMLNELMTIRFCSNNFNNSLNDETFRHLPHLTTLNLTGNNIQSLTSNVFDDIAKTIRIIDLRGNRLHSMPEGIFSIIRSSVFRIYLTGNPWRCDCSLVELKTFLSDPTTKNWFDSPLTCAWPLFYRYMEIIDAPFCRTTTPKTSVSTTETTTRDPPITTTLPEDIMTTIEAIAKPIECTICMETLHEDMNCSHPETSKAAFYFHEDDEMISVRKRTLSFRIDQSDDGNVQILVTNPEKLKYVIFWFSDTETDTFQSHVTNERVCAECTVTKENYYKITNLRSDALYIFCLMKYRSKEISPFDCLPYKTGIIPPVISWFDRHDKFIAYTISILSLLLCSFVGAFIMYCIIRKMPTLLKGSERVIIVKDKEIIVMPNGQKKLSKTDSGLETGQTRPLPNDGSAYLTPMPDLKPIYRKIHHRRASDTSLDSIRSYISTRAPTTGLQINRRTCYSDFQGRCFLDLKDVPNTPPPLPQRRSFEQDVVDYASIAKTPDANIYTPFDYGTIVAVQTELQNGEMQKETHTVHM